MNIFLKITKRKLDKIEIVEYDIGMRFFETVDRTKRMDRMNIILPIEARPAVRAYLHYAFPLSILMTVPYYTCWMLNHFIQLVYDPDHPCGFDYHEWLYTQWPCLEVRRCYKRDLARHGLSPLEFVKAEIADGEYVIAWVDAYYLPDHAHYQTHHWQHGVLIYGVNEDDGCFHTLYYGKGNDYREYRLPFDAFEAAYHGMLEDEKEAVYLDCTRIYDGACVDYDFYQIQHKLKCYLASKPYDVDQVKYHFHVGIEAYGVEACERLFARLASENRLDRRYLYVFCEHKQYMMYRIRMILEEYPIPDYPFTQDDRTRFSQDAERLLMLGVKWQLTQSERVRDAMLALAKELLEREREMLLPIVRFERDPATVLPRYDGKVRYKPLHVLGEA